MRHERWTKRMFGAPSEFQSRRQRVISYTKGVKAQVDTFELFES